MIGLAIKLHSLPLPHLLHATSHVSCGPEVHRDKEPYLPLLHALQSSQDSTLPVMLINAHYTPSVPFRIGPEDTAISKAKIFKRLLGEGLV